MCSEQSASVSFSKKDLGMKSWTYDVGGIGNPERDEIPPRPASAAGVD
jgi:hypothetical protein